MPRRSTAALRLLASWAILPFAPPLLPLPAATAPEAPAPPRSVAGPDSLQVHPALEVSLFAREPDIVDPVALAFDEFGRAYVVEMRDYPYGFGPERRPGGTVRLLEDRDGDGRADRSVIFARDLSFPTSVTCWNGGLLIAAPPEILFLRDADGDGTAEVRETVITGFKLGVTDSNLNGLRFGPDNWFHAVNGGNGGHLRSPRGPDEPLPLGDHDLRFQPATGRIERTAHTGGGFGLVFDDWGRSFTTYNIDHLQQRVADAAFFSRASGLPPVATTHSISDHGEMARIFPISPAVTRPNHPEQAGYFSAAGGMGYLGHQAWPRELRGASLVCDVVGNLVHRDVLRPDGPIQKASRAPDEQTREFIAATDNAFRPVGLEFGPDGALYLLDMQREVIEHPDYIPAKLLERIDLRAGDDRGRLYRLAPKGWTSSRDLPGLASPSQLVALLASPNPWTHTTARRLLVERRDPAVLEPLRTLARQHPEALARLHALWTLDGVDGLDDVTLRSALRDPTPGVRENAVQLVGRRLARNPAWTPSLAAALDDSDPSVRFHAALAIGGAPDESSYAPGLLALLLRDHRHPWSRRAVLSALTTQTAVVLGQAVERVALLPQPLEPSLLSALEELASVAAARAHHDEGLALTRLLARISDRSVPAPLQTSLFLGLLDGWQCCPRPPSLPSPALEPLGRLLEAPHPPPLLAAAGRLARRLGLPESPGLITAIDAAARRATRPNEPLPSRLEAIPLLELGEFSRTAPTLFELLRGAQPSALQHAAFAILRDRREPDLAAGLIRAWPTLAPSLRPSVVNLLVYRPAFHPALLAALEDGSLPLGQLNLDLEHRRQLLRKAAPDIRTRAARFLGDEEYSNRKAVVDDWLARLPASGVATRGRPVFERLCASCHRSGDLGFRVGPDLTGLSHRSVEDLLSNILDPNMAMNPAYVAFTAELADGETETGILENDSPESVTLVQAGEHRVLLPRASLRQLASEGRSLMPEGLETGLSPAELRDLIAFLQDPPSVPPATTPSP